MFGERSRCDLSPLPCLLLGFLGVPLAPLLRRMVTVQSPKKSQLAKKPACSLVANVSLGLRLPFPSPSGSGCLSPEVDGLQPANSVPSFVLCTVLVVSYVRAFHVVAIPQSGLLAQVSSLWLHSGHSGPILVKQCSPHLPAQPPLASGGCRRLHCFSSGGVTPGLIICGFYLFIFLPCYVALCASKARHRLGSESVSWCLETSLLKIPFPGRSSLPTSFVSFFIFYIFPTCV